MYPYQVILLMSNDMSVLKYAYSQDEDHFALAASGDQRLIRIFLLHREYSQYLHISKYFNIAYVSSIT